MVNVLLIGNGAREHALAAAIKRSPQKPALYSYLKTANPGIVELSDEHTLGEYSDIGSIKAFAQKVKPDYAVIGPEAPLAEGAADELEQMGIPCFGPRKELAKLETSKAFTRELMSKYDIEGNVSFRIFHGLEGIKTFIESLDSYVIKPDGLTGGKGVKVDGEHLHSIQDALDYCREVLETHDSVIIEEKLEGEEFSLQCLTDGKTVIPTPPAQDHKRAFEDDLGPNTGGMGSYSCADHLLPFIEQKDVDSGLRITQKVADALYKETGLRYKGVMYAGLIKTRDGVKLIEYNARFGDPEAMNTLPVLKTDFIELLSAISRGQLDELKVEFEKKATVCKYAVPQGYPDSPKTGKIDISAIPDDALVFFASVEKKQDGYHMGSSRTIGCVGIGDSLDEAERIAENAVSKIIGPVFHRSDIGTEPLIQKRIKHIEKLGLAAE